MAESAIDVTQKAANDHFSKARSWFKSSIRAAAASPYRAMRRWHIGMGVHDYSTAEERARRVTEFNDQLSDCRSCIAPETTISDDDEEIIEAAIKHFEALAEECSQHADDLRRIILSRF